MSIGVDLDDLGAPQQVQDLGSVTSDPPVDLTNTLPLVQFAQDQGGASLFPGIDLQDTVGNTTPTNQDQGPAMPQTAPDMANLGPPSLTQDSITFAYWQDLGFDTGTLVETTWLARTPLAQATTQNPVANISTVRLDTTIPTVLGSAVVPGPTIWVADGGNAGYPIPPTDPRLTTIRVLTTSNPPVLVSSIDISAYAAPSPFATTVRMLRMTADGNHVLACLHTAPPNPSHATPWAPGKVLFINKFTHAVEGVALLSTTSAGFQTVQGARDCVDTHDGHLWVINATGGNTSNALETFVIATVLANGPGTPTPSFQSVTITNHAEELSFGVGNIWTAGGAYSKTITQINPTTTTITTFTGGNFYWGTTFAFGAIWAGDDVDTGNIYRFSPDLFPGPGTLTNTLAMPHPNTSSPIQPYNGFVSDGTHLWVSSAFSGSATSPAGALQMYWWKVDPSAVTVLNTVGDVSTGSGQPFEDGSQSAGAYDGTNIWFVRFEGVDSGVAGIARINPTTSTLTIPNFNGGGSGYWQGPRTILYVP